MTSEPPDDEQPPFDALTAEPPQFGEPRSNVLTPMGEVESLGDFARGLGARRIRVTIFAIGAVLLALAFIAAVR